MSDCLFCRIVAGEVPADVVAESDRARAFRDIAPQSPVHVLVVPKQHVTSADHFDASHGALVSDLVRLAQEVADLTSVRDSGYRLVMNVGADAQMTVPHLHLHVLGGRLMDWPPG